MAGDNKTAVRIAALNDEFRQAAGLTQTEHSAVLGRCFLTAGVAALSIEAQVEILDRVRNFSDFKPANDPHREHDFGSIALTGGDEIFWKIDYYADAEMEYGSEDPADPNRSFRVLTIMLAADY
jgi:Protein of unknown function (DUF3768)